MRIDCKNLECPQPVINTKNALESLKIGERLEIEVNSLAPLENIKRFLTSCGLEYEVESLASSNLIKTTKTKEISSNLSVGEFVCNIPVVAQKVVYINDDRAGSGEVGVSLIAKFLSSIPNLTNKPTKIICVNKGVILTTDRSHPAYEVLKNLEKSEIEILSCGSCLEAYKLVDKLGIGSMTNAYEVMQILSENEVISL
ncbi:MAG: sulfurtransferase-like selenium metabolism protein YedF [Campylobacter sp.]|nr:sulfurtransferase-like selenium metabolism protein YedF [Campylobacter sp.]